MKNCLLFDSERQILTPVVYLLVGRVQSTVHKVWSIRGIKIVNRLATTAESEYGCRTAAEIVPEFFVLIPFHTRGKVEQFASQLSCYCHSN